MNPPLFITLSNTPAVTALLGVSPLRVYPWGEAPQNSPRPYATYGVYNGLSENYLDRVPDIDNLGTQIDIWAETGVSCNACFVAIRDAIEPIAHVTGFQAAIKDEETQLYHSRLEVDFWTPR